MEDFYASFTLESQISVRQEALRLFGLREDELMPDLHITRDGVLRIRLGAHQEHQVNHVARTTGRTEVSGSCNPASITWRGYCASTGQVGKWCQTLTEVKVQVTRNRMILLPWWLMLRKFGYSEHCVYTGAMLSFIYSLFGFWEFIVWSEGSRRCILAFLLWVFSGRLVLENVSFLPIGFLEERSFRDMRSIGDASWCVEWVKGICFGF